MKQDSDINYEKGLSFLKGDGVEKDPKTALFYLRKAVSEGNIEACFTILNHYLIGEFDQEDVDDQEALKMARVGRDYGEVFSYFTAMLFEKFYEKRKLIR